jgi:hypothetical protein
MTVSFSKWNYIDDGVYPEVFEVILVVLKDGRVTGGYVDSGMYLDQAHRYIRQSRGGIVFFRDILAWCSVEDKKVEAGEA